MKEEGLRITIVEDNPVVKDAFAVYISELSNHKVVNTYTTCESALENLIADNPDIILMDIELPGMNGIQGIKEVRKILPRVNIIVITVHDNSEWVFEALVAGASGYITKTSNHIKIIEAINELAAGGAPMSGNIAKMVVQSFRRTTESPLTPRETEVLQMLAKGQSYQDIADALFVHIETVKSHIKNIYFKLQVNNKAAAIEKGIKDKLF
ncbi:response regulator transcription factor [soil metagenome]